MSNSLDIYVVDNHDNAVSGVKVEVVIAGIMSGGSIVEYTDGSGHASFETASDYNGSRELSIYVRGQSFGPYSIGGGSYTVQLD